MTGENGPGATEARAAYYIEPYRERRRANDVS